MGEHASTATENTKGQMMHDKLNRVEQFLKEYQRVCRQCGCVITEQNGDQVVERADSPTIDDTVAAIQKRHRQAAAPPADESTAPVTEPAPKPARSKKPHAASAPAAPSK